MIKAEIKKNCYTFSSIKELLDFQNKDSIDSLDISGNELEIVPPEILKLPTLRILNCDNCDIKNIDLKDSNIIYLNISDNQLETMPLNMTKLISLLINGNTITNIDYIHDDLQLLGVDNCEIKIINKLPAKLKRFSCNYVGLEKINCEFPKDLSEISLVGNMLTEIPKIHENIKILDLSDNPLRNFVVPKSVEKYNIDDNCLAYVKHNEIIHHAKTYRL
jgi:Leucine-rich repeat (LRR) protein